ncbi:MAG: tetratricopeptide repeat protein, partial [Gammaproteobacteria bacterium]|nr:tetratricopeptide repeat protein [Gammaproteobacteria bacterium]
MDAAERLAVLGYQLYNASRFAEAEQVFTELTRRTPRDAMQWCNLGTSRRSQGKLNEALAAFSRAAELGARSANFYYNVGLVHLDRRDYESARAVLGRALELTPRDTAVRLEYVKACYESARTEEALAALEQAPELDDLEGSALAQSAQQLINVGASERALRAAQRAVLDLELLGVVEEHLEPRGIRSTFVHGKESDGNDLPGLEALKTADLLFLSVRRRALPSGQLALVRECLARNQPGHYQFLAAINAVHTDAPSAADTDWAQIAALYAQLYSLVPTPVVALNRAVALAELDGPSVALA